jgi:hypothetical protein
MDWVSIVYGLATINVWAGLMKNKNRPINISVKFSSKIKVIFFTGVFLPLTKSKNYEIQKVVRGL